MLGRFAKPIAPSDLEKAVKGVVPANTDASMDQARKNVNAWASHCSSVAAVSKSRLIYCRAMMLMLFASVSVATYMYMYVMETRKTDSFVYPSATLQ